MESIELMAKQLKAVSDPNRLKLLACLKKSEVCACDFVDVLHISQPAVSQHLKKLKEAGIIVERSVRNMEALSIKRSATTLYSSYY